MAHSSGSVHELRRQPFVFPDFEEWVEAEGTIHFKEETISLCHPESASFDSQNVLFEMYWAEGNPSTWWNVENDKLLQKHYPTATRRELMELFPDRPVNAIYRRASILRLKKTKEDRESGKLDVAEDLSLMDYAVMEQYGLCWKTRQKDSTLKYPGYNNGGEHGVSVVCYSGQSG